MLLIDALDKIAEACIPDGIHEILHVHSRTAWVETMMELIDQSGFKPSKEQLWYLAQSWEIILMKKYSSLN